MTQEDKELLLKDLSARLPYGVHCCIYNFDGTIRDEDDLVFYCAGANIVTLKGDAKRECFMYHQVKPYLRPMSSMTEEEKDDFYDNSETGDVDTRTDGLGLYFRGEFALFEDITYAIDWLNAHYFDYRHLIEKGLALEAPEGMYKTK